MNSTDTAHICGPTTLVHQTKKQTNKCKHPFTNKQTNRCTGERSLLHRARHSCPRLNNNKNSNTQTNKTNKQTNKKLTNKCKHQFTKQTNKQVYRREWFIASRRTQLLQITFVRLPRGRPKDESVKGTSPSPSPDCSQIASGQSLSPLN